MNYLLAALPFFGVCAESIASEKIVSCEEQEACTTPCCEPKPCCDWNPCGGHYQICNGCGFTVTASALYWKPQEESIDFVIQNTGTTGINDGGIVKRAEFDWDWGFRAGLGYQMPCQMMDLHASWTYFKSTGTTSQNVDFPTTLFSVWSLPTGAAIPPTAFEQSAKAKSHLTLNMLDVGIGATFSPCCFLDIFLFADLSTMWLDQKFQFNLSGGPGLNGHVTVDDQIKMTNDFWGIGPKIGLDTLWILGCGFGIVANMNLSLLYGEFRVTQNETTIFSDLTPPTVYLDIDHNRFHLGRLNFDFLLGLRWDAVCFSDCWHFLLEAGWESIIFLGQNQLMRFPSQVNHGINISGKGDLTLQGVSVRAAVIF